MKIDEQYLRTFVNLHNYDVRQTGNSRFTDQKCIPDVVCAVAECILEYVGEDTIKTFTKNDVWHFDYSEQLVEECFFKPNTESEDMQSEYDKFFAQPMKMFAAAGILEETKVNGTNTYVLKEKDILEYISLREKNALIFLDVYLTKVMEDCGLMSFFTDFFNVQDKNSLYILRDKLMSFYHTYTPINGEYEPKRIFNKIINIMAFRRRKCGAVKGFVSKYPLTIDEIRYNRQNWRDIDKPKGISRQEFAEQTTTTNENGYYERAINQAKRFVKDLEQYSEVHHYPAYIATDAHHIFMKSEYPELADMPENIIALTGTEHYSYAHPNRNTQRTDPNYQMICLISKLDSIERNFQAGNDDYSLADFTRVLNVGLSTDEFSAQMGYEMIKAHLLQYLRPA